MKLELMTEAMQRLLCPEFFDENGKPIGDVMDRLQACNDAINAKLRERAAARGALVRVVP